MRYSSAAIYPGAELVIWMHCRDSGRAHCMILSNYHNSVNEKDTKTFVK